MLTNAPYPALAILVAALACSAPSPAAGQPPATADASVVQIFVDSQPPNWREPWRSGAIVKGTGSGFVISGKRIMTNAHVVRWPREIYVKRTRDEKAYPARVAFIAHDSDLAILEVIEHAARFFADAPPLEFGAMPALLTPVDVYGYPAGGRRISQTRGVVSRYDVLTYAHTAHRRLLAGQTDAAINPGNSGGPVVHDGRAVGVSFQGIRQLENTGYFIPPPVIRRFLKDIEDGTYEGVIEPDFHTVPLRDKAERQLLRSPHDDRGVLLDSFRPAAASAGLLRVHDVLYRVGDTVISTDGSAMFGDHRLHWSVALLEAQAGDTVEFELLREGRTLTVPVPMNPYRADAARGRQFDQPPRYLVYGGLVFTPLSRDYLSSLGRHVPAELLYQFAVFPVTHPEAYRPEPVVFSHTLAHAANADLVIRGGAVLDRLNGVRINSMRDVERAFEASRGSYHFLEFTDGRFEAIDRMAADAAQDDVADTYGIPRMKRL